MRVHTVLSLLGAAATFPTSTLAWGVVGHEVVATIAQIFLHDSTEAAIKDILPDWTGGKLAPVAAWADRVRMHYHWSGQLHYVSPANDHPPVVCAWTGEVKTDQNVLQAVLNYTSRVQQYRQDEDLRFLVHYVGDMHQPLHLMERERGGNGDPVLFENRHFSLHGLWDSQMISRTIREQTNYTSPGPSQRVESVLRDSIYDPYIRLIAYEGLRVWWKEGLDTWLQCPAPPPSTVDTLAQKVFGAPEVTTTSEFTTPCPFDWSEPTHALTCSYVFPENYSPEAQPLQEVGGAYYARVKGDNVLELQLAQAGIRLAAILNHILGEPGDVAAQGGLNLAYLQDDHVRALSLGERIRKWF